MNSVITVLRTELEHGLRSEGLTTRKIEQFTRVFDESEDGAALALNSTRAQLINVNGFEQGLDLKDFIKAWWVYWAIVFHHYDGNQRMQDQATGAIRALHFVDCAFKHTETKTSIQMWWRDNEPVHGCALLEAY